MKSELSRLFGETVKVLESTRYFTKDEINAYFKSFESDCKTNFAKFTIGILEESKRNVASASVIVNGNSRCYDFTKKPTEDIDKLIDDIRKYSEYPSEQYRLSERAKTCKTFDDILAFLQEELVGKECSDIASIHHEIRTLLLKINKNIYIATHNFQDKEMLVFLDCGKEAYHFDRTWRKSFISFENAKLFDLSVSRKIVGKEHHGYYGGTSNKYAIKSIEMDKGKFNTLEEAYNAWKSLQDEKADSKAKVENAFLDGLKEHGFDSFEDFCTFCKTASDEQRKQF